MPWMSIIIWILSFIISKSSGASNGKAALIATGAGLASYYTIDPANTDNIFGVTLGDAKPTPGDPNITSGSNADVSGLGSVAKTLISETSSTLQSWGPTGTLGVVAGTAAVTSSSLSKYLPWVAGFAALILLSR